MKSIISVWDRAEHIIIGLLLAGAMGITVLEVVSRSIFGFSFYWAQEFIVYFIIWSTFLGASQVLKKSEHIRVNILVNALPAASQRYVDMVTTVIGLVFCLFLLVSGVRLVTDAYVGGVTSSSLAHVPLWMPYSIMPIAGILLSFRFIERFFMLWKGRQ